MSVWIHRVYTKGGDGGDTSLVDGTRVGKDTLRIEAYGTVDELNAVVGLLRKANTDEPAPREAREQLDSILGRVQNELFNLGSLLATPLEALGEKQPRIEARHTEALEREIDALNDSLEPLRSFVLPGGGSTSSYFHLARTVCRRAERVVVALSRTEKVDPECVRYLNRLSDAFFVFGRWCAKSRSEPEVLWTPEKT